MTKKSSDREACLGIFWLVNGKLIIDGSPLSEAEPYGDHMNHPRGHVHVWEEFERSGRVPCGSEYEEFPRGRVMFNTKNASFTILADQCILKHEDSIAQIKKALHLLSFAEYRDQPRIVIPSAARDLLLPERKK